MQSPVFLSGLRARASVLLAASVFTASCLESSATLPTVDGGARLDTGTVHPADAATGVDAHSGVDSTTGTDAHTGAETSTGTDAAVVPLCLNPTAADQACFSCVDTKCAVDVGPAIACTAFYSCFEKCDCSKSSCLSACLTGLPSSCDTPLENLNRCQTTTCGSACNPPDAGTKDASAPAGDAGATCKNPTATQEACASCEEMSCASVVSTEKSACSGSFATCFDACDCTDTSCITTCAEAAPSDCQSALEALQSCQTGAACGATCSGGASDGGKKDGGGSTGTVPDCKNPTSTQSAAYASCLACDNQYCAADISAAVAGCSAYYSCIASTDCSTALTSCTASSACNAAAAPLTLCQSEICGFACAGLY